MWKKYCNRGHWFPCQGLLLAGIFALGMLLLAAGGCASTSEIVHRGAELNDDAVGAAQFVICRGASIGAIRRAYGQNEFDTMIWREFCDQADADVFTPLSGEK